MLYSRLDALSGLIRACEYTTPKGRVEAEDALAMQQFLLRQTAAQGGTVYALGNGGSSSIASHFVVDLLKAVGMRAQGFSEGALLTCFANDCGYEEVYRAPLNVCLTHRDLLVLISSSGQSANIVHAAQCAKKMKTPLITLSGFAAENPLRMLGDLNLWLGAKDYGLVEIGHSFLLHTLIDVMVQEKRQGVAHVCQN